MSCNLAQGDLGTPSPLDAPECFGIPASPKASRRIAAIPKGPSPPAQTLTPGLQEVFRATRRKMRDDAFLWDAFGLSQTCVSLRIPNKSRQTNRRENKPCESQTNRAKPVVEKTNLAMSQLPRKTCVSLRRHAFLRHRFVALL